MSRSFMIDLCLVMLISGTSISSFIVRKLYGSRFSCYRIMMHPWGPQCHYLSWRIAHPSLCLSLFLLKNHSLRQVLIIKKLRCFSWVKLFIEGGSLMGFVDWLGSCYERRVVFVSSPFLGCAFSCPLYTTCVLWCALFGALFKSLFICLSRRKKKKET